MLNKTCMKRLKNIPRDNQLSTSSSTDNSTPSTSSFTSNSTPSTSSFKDNFITRSSDTYIYGLGIVAFPAIGGCVYFAYDKKLSQAANKEQANKEQQQPIKPPKQRSMH